jgi:hypothetical protein
VGGAVSDTRIGSAPTIEGLFDRQQELRDELAMLRGKVEDIEKGPRLRASLGFLAGAIIPTVALIWGASNYVGRLEALEGLPDKVDGVATGMSAVQATLDGFNRRLDDLIKLRVVP